jgi:hypothetical protein
MDQRLQFLSSYQKEEMSVADLCREYGISRPTGYRWINAKGLLLRRVNNSGDISWHKNRVFISEVFRFEELAFELITPGFYRVFFRDMEIGELNAEELRFRAARRVV